MLPEDSGADGVGPDRREAGSQSFHFSSASGAVSLHESIVKGEAESIEGITVSPGDEIQIVQIVSGHLVAKRNICFLSDPCHISVINMSLIRSGSLYRSRIRIRIRGRGVLRIRERGYKVSQLKDLESLIIRASAEDLNQFILQECHGKHLSFLCS